MNILQTADEASQYNRKKKLIELKNVKKHYIQKPSLLERLITKQKERVIHAVDDISLVIYSGETLGLVGESGCGKSTLGRTIIKLHEPTSGEIIYEDMNLNKIRGQELKKFRQKAQIIFQNPYSSLNPRKTVREILRIALLGRGVSNYLEQEKELRVLVDKVGLSARHLDNYPHQFSGGQRQRIGIARALAMNPEFIVADEPVSALDVSVQAQIIKLLKELQREMSLTYLFITHDLSVVHYVSDRIAVMYLGRLVELAETKKLFQNPKHPYTQALLSSIPTIHKEKRRQRIILQGSVSTPLEAPKGCSFYNRCAERIHGVCDKVPPLWQEKDNHWVACHLYQ
ncbi:ABC transporter ATP-binding protein [Microaerobacter geothermalis]|uniref:ABC transporter ATP-binding protein n=1 Tax=Microaerobacter geothermalis TaxID=674972 RepID=UPI001F1DC4B4|nr:ABC transporter ATP-binding protein [Microaerobacter geothermalis]MCF6093859.1 ABC transporter ATP-binding protein [Microaerobacter geothermalis]